MGKSLPRVGPMTTTRVKLKKLSPDFYKAMIALDSASAVGVDPPLAELVRIRASQLNGCAHCLDMHSKDARAGGETEQRLYVLSAWRESPGLYTEKEQAALALTEAVTLVADGHVPDDVYERAAAHFPDAELSQLISLIVTINAWNRIAVTTRLGIS
jgi:AhpD family alkylhydroperoxidase